MTPEYLEELADIADPEQLWRLPGLKQLDLPPEKRRQLDAGVALRRHARHVRTLRQLLEEKRSLLITPLGSNHRASKSVDTPEDHERLRPPPATRQPDPTEWQPIARVYPKEAEK